MAAPTVSASAARPLDPLRQNKFTLHVSDGLLSKPRETTAYSSINYNYKPKLQPASVRTSTISQSDDERASLTLCDRSGDGTARFTYAGQRKDLKRTYALVFDQDNHRCTLEPLASSYSFNIQSTPTESSAAKLAERYPKLNSKHDVDAGSKSEGEGAAVDPNEPGDDDNPFDFRHFLRQTRDASRSVSPDAARSHATTPLNGSNRTPLSRPAMGKASPLVGAKKNVAPPRKRSPAAGTTLSKSKTANTPEVRLERRATARPAPSGKKGKSLKSITQPKKNPTVKSSEFVDSSDDDDIDMEPAAVAPSRGTSSKSQGAGGLDIDMGRSAPPKPQGRVSTSKKKDLPSLGTPTNGPISLRSAANSAAASPAHNMTGTSLHKAKSFGDGQVIDFGDTSAVSNGEASDDEADSSEDASGEYDHDIEPITLGSPAHETRSATTSQPSEDTQHGHDADAEGDDDDFEMFEEAYQELSEADVDKRAAPPATQPDDESEESEEE